jgi:hypothetical protein
MDMTRVHQELLSGAIVAVLIWIVLVGGEFGPDGRMDALDPLRNVLVVTTLQLFAVIIASLLLYFHVRHEPPTWIDAARLSLVLGSALLVRLLPLPLLDTQEPKRLVPALASAVAALMGSIALYHVRRRLVKKRPATGSSEVAHS